MRTIPCTVAGRFYPADARELARRVRSFLQASEVTQAGAVVGIIAPHAGYDYCGRIAGAAYASLLNSTRPIHKVLLLGTWHQRGAGGIAATEADAFATPLGEVAIDHSSLQEAKAILGSRLVIDDRAHTGDHALQVQLPFLQVVLGHLAVVPLLVGAVNILDVAALVRRLGTSAGCLVVVSSDLSHYHDDPAARRIDHNTAKSVVELDADSIGPQQACGHHAVAGLLVAAQELGWNARLMALGNSGDVSGKDEKVVGYGAFCFEL